MKKQILLFLGLIAFFLLTAEDCEKQDSNSEVARQQELIVKEGNRQIGMPAIVHFQERKLLKMIYELRDQENLICYAYIIPEMTGRPVFLGKCIGYGIPYATQFSNPEQDVYYTSSSAVHHNLPQAEPNGLFMPASAEATWLMMIDPKTNETHPVYIETRILVSPFKLTE